MNEFSYIYSKEKHRYYGIGNLVDWTKKQIAERGIHLEKDNYRCQCPYCLEAYKHDSSYEGPYLKPKLYVTEDMDFGHCFRCDRVFMDASQQAVVKVRTPKFDNESISKPVYKLSGDKWNVDMFSLFSEFTQEGYDYLVKKRHFLFKKLYKVLNIRFFKENPVIPFFYRGELIYFQIKYADKKKHGMPYFSPPIDDKPAYIIEHGDNKKFVICEGTFDAIACLILFPDRTPFAVLGSSITPYQVGMLRSYCPEDILIYMDETSISEKIERTIKDFLNYASISIKYSSGQDPEEYLKERLKEQAEVV